MSLNKGIVTELTQPQRKTVLNHTRRDFKIAVTTSNVKSI